MIKFLTHLETIDDLKQFVQEANRTTGKAIVSRGEYRIPAASIMTLISMNPSKDFTVELERSTDMELFTCPKTEIKETTKTDWAIAVLFDVLEQNENKLSFADSDRMLAALEYLKANM